MLIILDADRRHAPGIAEIYNDAVRHTTAIWNDTVVDVPDRLAWMDDRRRGGHPVLVAVDPSDHESVLGYASFGDWRAFDGYRHTVEHSVYVRGERRGRGLGRLLMTALIERARAADKHVMVAAIEASNSGSIRLHESLGFEPGGVLRQVGTKFGDWLDLVFLQLRLDERPAPTPAPPT